MLSRLKHPNIARFIASGKTASQLPYLVIEFLSGWTLEEVLVQRRRNAGRFRETPDGMRPIDHREREGKAKYTEPLMTYRDIYAMGEGALHGLTYLYDSGIRHRDLKPGNIMLERDEQGDGVPKNVKILDFGLVKIAEGMREAFRAQTTYTQLGVVMGTPSYMSPEQIKCTADVDERTDVYALGVVLFEMATGLQPYASATGSGLEIFAAILTNKDPLDPSDYVKNVPQGLSGVIRKATMPEVKDRYRNAREMLAAFQAAKTAYNTGNTEEVEMSLVPQNRRTSGLGSLALAGASALLIGGVGTFLVSPFIPNERPARVAEAAASSSAHPLPAPSRSPMVTAPSPSVPVASPANELTGAAQSIYEMGTAYAKRGLHRRAIESFESARSLAPKAPEIYERLAECHDALGHSSEAVEAREKARTLRNGI